YDLVNAFFHFYQAPRVGEVYNMGGSRFSNCSLLEAIALCEDIAGKKLKWTYADSNRIGDHIWWISDVSKFPKHFHSWKFQHELNVILGQIFQNNTDRWI